MRWPLLGLALVLLTAPDLALGQSSEPVKLPGQFDAEGVDAYVADVVRRKGIAGLALAVAKDGKIVLAKGYGKRSIEAGSPVGPESPFAVGSVTKQFACACILLLAEDGKLSVDDKVAKYYPDLTRAGDITLHQLMTHTSGYADYYPLDFVDRRLMKPIAVDEVIKDYAGGKLDFEPGARWSYSNTGYLILGRVVEKVAGEPFGEFLRRRILAPIGMEHSAFEPTGVDASRASGYLPFALGAPEPAVPEASGWLHAAGGLWASAPDLVRWDLALMDGRVLKPGSMRLMTCPVTLTDGRIKDYGCGVNVRRSGDAMIVSHGGAVSGFRATNIFIPRTRSAVAVVINDEQGDPTIAQAIAGLLSKAESPTVDIPKVEGPSAKDAALDFFRQMQTGKVDRSKLGEEFSIYLTDERLKAGVPRLKALGEPSSVAVLGTSERGGLEVSTIRLTFKSEAVKGVMYRSTDGKIQQLLFEKN